MEADGGEASIITDFSLGVREFSWSPDGGSLLVLATNWTEYWADLDDDARARMLARSRPPDTDSIHEDGCTIGEIICTWSMTLAPVLRSGWAPATRTSQVLRGRRMACT